MEICDLSSVGVTEKDCNNDVLWVWSFPLVSSDIQHVVLKKCGVQNFRPHPISFCYFHHKVFWFYLYFTEVSDLDKLNKVKQCILILQSRDFNPDRYKALSRIMSTTYRKTGSPLAILQLYLSVLIKGCCCAKESGSFSMHDFDIKSSLLKAPVKGIIKMFGLETILIYTALILRKRIIVYHHHMDTLLSFVRIIPAFIYHRLEWNILYPYMQLNEADCDELHSLQSYVAGFTDAAVESRPDLYDVFVNIAATEISISSSSKDIFAMTKTHKDIAMFMIRLAENTDLSDQHIIKDIEMKTQELLSSLKSICSKSENGNYVLCLSTLKEKRFGSALENFLWNLAIAEGFVEI